MSYIHFFSALTDTITSFAATGGYTAIFIIILLEGLPLIGVVIPGHVIVVSAGFLASTGVLNPYTALAAAIVGAIIGDIVSYYLGYRYGWPLIEKLRPYFFVSERVLIRTREFLEKHTGKALFLGRFNPVTRGLMPFFVGSNKLNIKKFLVWNTLGICVWVGSSVALGYLIGLGFSLSSGWLSRVAATTIIIVALLAWSYRFVNARFHVFRKFELFALGLNLASVIVLIRMIADAFSLSPFMTSFDLWVNDISSYTGETAFGVYITKAAAWVSAIGSVYALSLVSVCIGIYFASKKKWRSAAIMLASVGSTVVFAAWLKGLVERVRPTNFVLPEAGSALHMFFDGARTIAEPSFPSGHAAVAAAFCVALVYVFTPRIRSWVTREIFIVISVGCAIAVGLSRLLLNVHWASDVIAGWALGIFCATISILFVRYLGALIQGKIQS